MRRFGTAPARGPQFARIPRICARRAGKKDGGRECPESSTTGGAFGTSSGSSYGSQSAGSMPSGSNVGSSNQGSSNMNQGSSNMGSSNLGTSSGTSSSGSNVGNPSGSA